MTICRTCIVIRWDIVQRGLRLEDPSLLGDTKEGIQSCNVSKGGKEQDFGAGGRTERGITMK